MNRGSPLYDDASLVGVEVVRRDEELDHQQPRGSQSTPLQHSSHGDGVTNQLAQLERASELTIRTTSVPVSGCLS